jgi:hypothetical protein
MNKFFNTLLFLTVIGLAVWIILDRIRDKEKDELFLQKQIQFTRVIDSLKGEIPKKDSVVLVLFEINDSLQHKIDTLKSNVKVVVKYVDSSKLAIDNFTERELITFYNERYPKDTTSNKLPVAQPVLTNAAKELAELDGTRKMLMLKDSILATIGKQVEVKDSIINVYVSKEGDYKTIIVNQDSLIKNWDNRYKELDKKYQKAKIANKIIKTASGVIIAAILIL